MEIDREVHSDNSAVNSRVSRSRFGCVSWFIIFIFVTHAVLSWDSYIADYRLSKLCAQPANIGQFVYHRQFLDDTFFLGQNVASGEHHGSSYYSLPDGSVLEKATFERKFIFEIYSITRVSNIGPIDLIHSTVTRRSDELLLGEARSYRNFGGWIKYKNPFYRIVETCPSNLHETSETSSDYLRIHRTLLDNIFSRLSK